MLQHPAAPFACLAAPAAAAAAAANQAAACSVRQRRFLFSGVCESTGQVQQHSSNMTCCRPGSNLVFSLARAYWSWVVITLQQYDACHGCVSDSCRTGLCTVLTNR
jgi:hypothetical protein